MTIEGVVEIVASSADTGIKAILGFSRCHFSTPSEIRVGMSSLPGIVRPRPEKYSCHLTIDITDVDISLRTAVCSISCGDISLRRADMTVDIIRRIYGCRSVS